MSTSFATVEQIHQFLLGNEPDYPYKELVFDSNYDRSSAVYQKLYLSRETWRGPLFHLLTQPWFSRRWIIQEVAKAPKATVICGLQTLDWEILGALSYCFYKTHALNHIVDPAAKWNDFNLLVSNLTMLVFFKQDSKIKQHKPILNTIFSTRVFQSTDPRDAIYSLLGVAGDVVEYGHNLIPDYSLSVEEVFKRFATGCIIQKGNLHPLSLLYVPPTTGARDLPSWVVDFSLLDIANPLILTRDGNGSGLPFHAGGFSNPRTRVSDDGNLLYAWGKKLDLVHKRCSAIADMPFGDYPDLSTKAILEKRFNEWLSIRYEIYGDREEKFEAFWRSMILNQTEGWDRPPPEYGIWFQEYLDYRLGPNFALEEEDNEDNLDRVKVENAILNQLSTWCFCETEKGRFGQVLESVEVGDMVCILYGGELPYIIRPLEDGKYMFVGSCYMHGLMDGEGCEMDEVEDEEFCFR